LRLAAAASHLAASASRFAAAAALRRVAAAALRLAAAATLRLVAAAALRLVAAAALRLVVAALIVTAANSVASAAKPSYAPVITGRPLVFPADYGSHPEFRTEWWYVTGWLTTQRGESLGFQITFFRTKPDIDESNPSAFAAHQLLIAHCAISDPRRGRLWQDQRIRRAGLGLAEASVGDTQVWIDRWSLKRNASNYTATIDAEDFSFDVTLLETQAILLNGDSGVSRKSPVAQASSYYYSLPHLRVDGAVARHGSTDHVTGEAWFDHEWSSEYLDDRAAGWDWIGINLDDGAALMAFRIRDARGGQRWAGGTIRNGDGRIRILEPADIEFRAGRRWTSPRTQISYPVQWQLRAGSREFEFQPLLDDQENDTRLSTGAIYWEGAVRAYEQRRLVGRGYLELTGYGERLQLR
jgi:predicted secreted hydrolase